MKRVAVLGATGSIGASALDVIARHPTALRATVLAAGRQVDALVELCRQHRPEHAVIADEAMLGRLRDRLRGAGLSTIAHAGDAALVELIGGDACDTVVAAIVGAAGLPSTLASARAGKRLLLANKESLVLAGELLMAAAREGGATIVPIDSEHNAIFQCLPDAPARDGLARIILTASGGPFRGRSRASLGDVTVEQAVAHPKWSMGPKISVDSATLMNKGLEVIEAAHLFPVGLEKIRIVVHPQSVIHSLVEYRDGSSLAQLGPSDMRVPIASCLAWPGRMEGACKPLDLPALGELTFFPPDEERFPATRLAREAAQAGGAAPAVLNAANEVAVAAFLAGQIGFTRIAALVEDTLTRPLPSAPTSLEDVLAVDAEARATAAAMLEPA